MKTPWLPLVLGLSACAIAGMSPAQRQRASDCVALCERSQPPLPSGAMDKPVETPHDTRSDCEKRCGM